MAIPGVEGPRTAPSSLKKPMQGADMSENTGPGTSVPGTHADALVLFGATGDLAHKKIFPALYAMARRGVLQVPVIGVAFSGWDLAKLRARAEDSITRLGPVSDRGALDRLLEQLQYVDGDYRNPATFAVLAKALRGAHYPAFYLAIPPSLFATVITSLGATGLAKAGRVIVEKPFGRDEARSRGRSSQKTPSSASITSWARRRS
jgi:glucose-6-phosphate 1-dehydrogenase